MNKLVTLLILGIWIGLVLGLSFIEAPLKFQAPGITTELGVGIGRLVFGVLNKIEITFIIILASTQYGMIKDLSTFYILLGLIILGVVILQTAFLLPALDQRAQALLNGEVVKSSYHHFIFVAAEVIKLITLLILFTKSYKL